MRCWCVPGLPLGPGIRQDRHGGGKGMETDMSGTYTVETTDGTVVATYEPGKHHLVQGHGEIDDGWYEAARKASDTSREQPTEIVSVRDPDGFITDQYVNGSRFVADA